MRKAFRSACAIIITGAIAVLLCSLAYLGMQNRAVLDTNPGSPIPGPDSGQSGDTGKREAPQSATVDSAVDKYRAWLDERAGLYVEEDLADETALTVCSAFDAGMSYEEVSDAYQDGGMTMEESVVVVVGAVAYYCPEHNAAIDEYMNGVLGSVDGEV